MRNHRMLALVLGAGLLLAGCGAKGGDDAKVASISTPNTAAGATADNSSGKSDEDKMREFAKCMRDHGVDMPDPKVSGDGSKGMSVTIGGDGADKGKMDAAQKACEKFMPNGGQPKPMDPAELDKARKEAKCMRDHGIDMPDPDPSGKGATRIGGDGDPKKFEDAAKACGMGMATHSEKAKGK